VPTDKRARKRSAREQKMAALERQRRRRATIRRFITIAVIVAVAVGIYFLVGGGKKTSKTAQQIADDIAVAAGCPSSPIGTLTKPSWKTPPAMAIDTAKTYTAKVKTDLGSFTITLDARNTPLTVNNFVFLAKKNYFNCVTFHRVVPGFMDQTGDPTGTGSGNPGYKFADELPKAATPQYPVGAVAMANSGKDTNGSQFFVVTGSQGASLAPNYTLFGKVTSGMAVAAKINADGNANPTSNGVPPKVIHRILSVAVTAT
jgi:cyclophilin family peptidyl-prolyl cis-trans isomerase